MEWFVILWIVGIALWILSKLVSKTSSTVEQVKKDVNSRECPFCKSQIHKDAIVCRYCQRDVEPYKEPTAGEILSAKDERLRIINEVLQTFRESHPKVKFHFDNGLQRIKIKPTWFSGENSKKIRNKMIEVLNERGIKAKSVFLSDNEINTIGFWENMLEQTVEGLTKEKENRK